MGNAMSTTTVAYTLGEALKRADPNVMPDALRKCDLSAMFAAVEYNTGVLDTPVAAIPIPAPGALFVHSARVVSGDESHTPHIIDDSGDTAGAIVTGLYSAVLSADGLTLTFSDLVEQAIIRYVPKPSNALADLFQVP
jgi:hypothetical protein